MVEEAHAVDHGVTRAAEVDHVDPARARRRARLAAAVGAAHAARAVAPLAVARAPDAAALRALAGRAVVRPIAGAARVWAGEAAHAGAVLGVEANARGTVLVAAAGHVAERARIAPALARAARVWPVNAARVVVGPGDAHRAAADGDLGAALGGVEDRVRRIRLRREGRAPATARPALRAVVVRAAGGAGIAPAGARAGGEDEAGPRLAADLGPGRDGQRHVAGAG